MSSFRRCTSGKAGGGNSRVMPRGVTLAIVFAALAPSSAAAEETGSLLPYGRHLAQECTACHGADAGQGKESGIPRLAGRPAAELTDQSGDGVGGEVARRAADRGACRLFCFPIKGAGRCRTRALKSQ